MEKAKLPKFDYVFNPEDWEETYHDAYELGERYVEDSKPGTILEAQTLIEGPKIYGARVPLSFDEDGDWDHEEVEWFATKEEAQAAINRKPETHPQQSTTSSTPETYTKGY